mmetsp:Transcript_2573/g.5732  ORF Transcript_2573/g.5732 Transcript_2573/m.5732 type:complete len:306 (+) Transcript_2573:646-1563(+)
MRRSSSNAASPIVTSHGTQRRFSPRRRSIRRPSRETLPVQSSQDVIEGRVSGGDGGMRGIVRWRHVVRRSRIDPAPWPMPLRRHPPSPVRDPIERTRRRRSRHRHRRRTPRQRRHGGIRPDADGADARLVLGQAVRLLFRDGGTALDAVSGGDARSRRRHGHRRGRSLSVVRGVLGGDQQGIGDAFDGRNGGGSGRSPLSAEVHLEIFDYEIVVQFVVVSFALSREEGAAIVMMVGGEDGVHRESDRATFSSVPIRRVVAGATTSRCQCGRGHSGTGGCIIIVLRRRLHGCHGCHGCCVRVKLRR